MSFESPDAPKHVTQKQSDVGH